jgi:hypothetical protein
MKHLLCAVAFTALTSSFASAAPHTYEYTMKITAIRIWDDVGMQTPDSATLPIGSVAVGDLGRGSFGVEVGYMTGFANWGFAYTQSYQNWGALQQFTVGTISHVASRDPNSIDLFDSYDASQYPDSISFNSWRNSAEWLTVEFTDRTASHLSGTEPGDIGNFPLEHTGTFGFQMMASDGLIYRLEGTLLTLAVDGGPIVELPAPSPLPVPEPGTWSLLLAGLGVLGSGRLLRRQATRSLS